jgi:hypothetical protein
MTTTAAITAKSTEMSNKEAFTSAKAAQLALKEVTQENCLRWALKLMYAMKENTISNLKSGHLIEDYEYHCRKNNISTELY